MMKRILTYSVIAVLAIVLIGGTISILVRPNDVEAYGGPGANKVNNSERNGEYDGNGGNNGGRNSGTSGGGQGMGNAGNGGSGRGRGQENGNYTSPINWETITGVVLISDSELTVDTGSTALLVGLGQEWYREEQGFVVNVGDEVRIEGYEEDGEFKAGTVENLTLGTSIILRDASGRPMWSGQNALNSRGQGQSVDPGSSGEYGNGGGRGRGQENGEEDASFALPESPSTEELACPICGAAAEYNGPLSEEEVTALYLALNDEYHAWAVYEQVIVDFGTVRPFTSIQHAEQNHISALVHLFEVYNLPVPDNPWIGQVAGFENLTAACSAGVEAEIANGALYDTLYTSTDRDDILDVYTALQRASLEKHLPAFMKCAD